MSSNPQTSVAPLTNSGQLLPVTYCAPTIFHSSITTSRGEGEEQWYTRRDEAPREGRNSSDPCSAPYSWTNVTLGKKCTWITMSDFPVLASETPSTSLLCSRFTISAHRSLRKRQECPPSTWSWSSSLCFLCCCLVDRKVTCDLAVEATPAVRPPPLIQHVCMCVHVSRMEGTGVECVWYVCFLGQHQYCHC